jgi:hypothetical protein
MPLLLPDELVPEADLVEVERWRLALALAEANLTVLRNSNW